MRPESGIRTTIIELELREKNLKKAMKDIHVSKEDTQLLLIAVQAQLSAYRDCLERMGE